MGREEKRRKLQLRRAIRVHRAPLRAINDRFAFFPLCSGHFRQRDDQDRFFPNARKRPRIGWAIMVAVIDRFER